MKKRLLFLTLFIGLISSITRAQINYTQQEELVAPSPIASDNFGSAVVVVGDYMAVGVPNEDVAPANSAVTNEGATYIYKKNSNGSWVQVQKLVATARQEDEGFGSAICMDETTLLIGAPNTPNPSLPGRVFVYKLNTQTGLWEQSGNALSANGISSRNSFGQVLDLDDDYLIIGAPRHQSSITGKTIGKTYIYHRSLAGVWTEETSFLKPNVNHNTIIDLFGSAVGISDGKALVGSTQEDVMNNSGNEVNGGAVFTYKKNETTGIWEVDTTITASAPRTNGAFGSLIDLSGNYAVVSSPLSTVGARNQEIGWAWFLYYDESTEEWEVIESITPDDWSTTDGRRFGSSVNINGDWAVIGYEADDPSFQGSVYVYERTSEKNWNRRAVVTPDVPVNLREFGGAVSISGQYLAVGRPGGAGTAYVFQTNDIQVCEVAETPSITASNTEICQGDDVTLSIQSGNLNSANNWQWYSTNCGVTPVGAGTSINVSPSSETEYFVRGEGTCDPGNCGSITIQVNVNPTPVIVQEGGLVTTESFEAYQWVECTKDGNENIKNETNRTFTPTSSASYNVFVQDDNGCEGTVKDCFPVIITSLEESSNVTLLAYPNPTSDFINLNARVVWSLSSATGEVLESDESSRVDLTNYKTGLYFLILGNGITIKIIKE